MSGACSFAWAKVQRYNGLDTGEAEVYDKQLQELELVTD